VTTVGTCACAGWATRAGTSGMPQSVSRLRKNETKTLTGKRQLSLAA